MIWNPVQLISRAFRKREHEAIAAAAGAGIQTVEPKATTLPDPMWRMIGARLWREVTVLQDIMSARRDCWEMYVNDGDVAAQIDGLGVDACAADDEGLPFRIEPRVTAAVPFTTDERGRRTPTAEQRKITDVFQEVRDTFGAVGLYDNLAFSCSMAALLGEHFDRVIWDKREGKFWPLAVEPIPGIRDGMMVRPLMDPSRGNMRVGWGVFDVDTGQKLLELLPWEVMVYRWNDVMPVLASVRLQWKMLHENEEDMYGARKTRSYVKLNRVVEGASPQQLLEMQAAEDARKRDNPPGIDSDVISNTQAQLLDPANAQLQNVNDLIYRRRVVQSAGRKPIGELAAYGNDINRATLDKQDETYARLLSRLNAMANVPIKQLIRTMFAVRGIDPAEFRFALRWTEKNPVEFDKRVAGLALLRQQFKLSLQTGLAEAGYDFEQEMDNREYEQTVLGDDEDPFAARIASELARFGAGDSNGRPAAEADGTPARQPGPLLERSSR